MKSELFSIGPFHVYGYGLMIGIGIIVAFFVAMKRAEKKGMNGDLIFSAGLFGLIGGIIGAKLTFYLTEIPAIIEDPSMLWDFANGFVVYGGIIVGILTAYIYLRIKKTEFLPVIDLVVPSIALAQGFGRIGCFLAGCCYGRETHAWFGVTFPEGGLAPAGISLIPTQLISSAGDFLLGILLIFLAGKKRNRGLITGLYFLLYAVGRFLVEFLRNDPRGNVGVLSTSQFIAIFMAAAGIVLIALSPKWGSPQREDKAAEKKAVLETGVEEGADQGADQ